MSFKILNPVEVKAKLEVLRQYLSHLPASLPESSRHYSFQTFSWDPEKEVDFGGIDCAVNHALEIIFYPGGAGLGL
jgi:hypothetical protein